MPNGGKSYSGAPEGKVVDITSALEIDRTPPATPEKQAVQKALKSFEEEHRWDPNLPEAIHGEINAAIDMGDYSKEVAIEQALEEDSPYPEVRAAVRNYDEDVPANTIRMWVIGMIISTIGSGVNMLFSMRSPTITISALVAQLISYPIGVGWAKVMPNRTFRTFGVSWNLNPGPFNMKEHTLIVVMANVSFGAAYSTDTLLAMIAQYKADWGWGFALLLTISTQCIGYGMAGVTRRFLVWPASMIWPSNLVNTSLFYALHDHRPADPGSTSGWRIARFKYFLIVFAASFVWYWVPGFLATFLSVLAIPTFAAPNNVVVNQLFGGWTGLSLIPLTLDWTQIAGYVGSPLIPPWHAIGNTMIGLIVFYIIGSSAIHYSGGWYAKWLPISDSGSYDNTGASYHVKKILTPQLTFDENLYKDYSPLFLSTTFALSYGLSFATITSLIVHTCLFHGKEIISRAKEARNQEDDVHLRLMKKYKDAPEWWFLALFGITFALGLVTCLVWPTHLTWWGYIFALIIAAIWMIPIGMIQAVTNIQIGLNVITEFLVGYILPGRPVAMMLFKTYGYISMSQALAFASDLKLGHYMKIPPRTMFWTQTVATLWSCLVQVAVMYWALGNIKDVCTPAQENHFTCPGARVFFNASIIWGLIGPARIFSPGAIYDKLLYFFLVGAIVPVIIYFAAKKWPKSPAKYIMAPVVFGGAGLIPPGTPLNYFSWGVVGFIFNKLIRNRHRGWWSEYNYVTSAGLDVGLALSTIVIFFALTMNNIEPPAWWGNNIAGATMDAQGTAIQATVNATAGEFFGPRSW